MLTSHILVKNLLITYVLVSIAKKTHEPVCMCTSCVSKGRGHEESAGEHTTLMSDTLERIGLTLMLTCMMQIFNPLHAVCVEVV